MGVGIRSISLPSVSMLVSPHFELDDDEGGSLRIELVSLGTESGLLSRVATSRDSSISSSSSRLAGSDSLPSDLGKTDLRRIPGLGSAISEVMP